jgi:hypothetical protein
MRTRAWREYEQPAGAVVLGAYVFTNTRLLCSGIASLRPEKRAGCGRQELLLPDHLGVNVFFEDKFFNPFMGAGALGTTIDDFNNDHFDHAGLGFHGGAFISANHTNGRPIDTRPLPPGTPRWGSKFKEANAKWYLRAGNINCHGTSYSHRGNYLDLDPDYRDAWGRPLLRMTFDFPENDLKMSAFVTEKAHGVAKAMGATIANPVPRLGYDCIYQSTHSTGGTIMGADPASVVRRAWCGTRPTSSSAARAYSRRATARPMARSARSTRRADDLVRCPRAAAQLYEGMVGAASCEPPLHTRLSRRSADCDARAYQILVDHRQRQAFRFTDRSVDLWRTSGAGFASSRMRGGLVASARPMASICCSPPELISPAHLGSEERRPCQTSARSRGGSPAPEFSTCPGNSRRQPGRCGRTACRRWRIAPGRTRRRSSCPSVAAEQGLVSPLPMKRIFQAASLGLESLTSSHFFPGRCAALRWRYALQRRWR